MVEYTLFVEGQPIPKARPRVGKGHTHTPEKTRDYEARVGWAARAAGVLPFTGDVRITLTFLRKGKRRADLDNMVKSCVDGMNGIAYEDDKQVVELHASVVYGIDKPGVHISIGDCE